jgi:hypothetical protein
LLDMHATAYLATRGNELAHEVRRGGPHALSRSLELIALAREEVATRRVGGAT